MTDNRSEKVKRICRENVNAGCRSSCPLSAPCVMKLDDTKEVFDMRMNEFAEKI